MNTDPPSFRVWALDDIMYGPVTLEILRGWALDERITGDSWVFCDQSKRWSAAAHLNGLSDLFAAPEAVSEDTSVRSGALRRIRAFGALEDEQLNYLSRIGERQQFPAFTSILRVGAPGDSVYFVLDGQVRQRILVKGREILVGLQETGGVFGQISLFDGLPRVTDVLSDSAVTLFRIEAEAFRRLCTARPDIAVPILVALGRTLASRIRTDDKHLCEMVAMSQTAG